ncbi:MAG: ferritin family protein [Firmicutes bacterium]|nr:ferritin family protein [Candidatus Fermentithermobacillaceae bacterium]
MPVREVLLRAVHMEEKGCEIYATEAEKAKNPLVKGLFEELASDERTHAEKFRDLLRSLEDTGEIQFSAEELPPIEERVKDVFEKIGEVSVHQEGEPYIDALKAALDLEQESYKMYNDLFKRSTDPNEKEYFDILRKEEYEHVTSLANVLAYLTKSGMWFDVEESKRWNWMNI